MLLCLFPCSFVSTSAEVQSTADLNGKKTVFVAKQAIMVGTRLKDPKQYFAMEFLPHDNTPAGVLSSFDSLKRKYLKRNLKKGDHLQAEDLHHLPPVLQLSPGFVGVGIRLPALQSANLPPLLGKQVDIVWHFTQEGNKKSATIIENLLVVAVDSPTCGNCSDEIVQKEPAAKTVIVVAVTQEDAQRIQLAKDHGTLSVVLSKKQPGPK